jgi:hypothetical protein
MESTDDEDSPRGPYGPTKRNERMSLPNHDSLRELELKEARAERSKKHSSEESNNNKNISGHLMVEPTPAPPILSTPDNSNSSLLDGAKKVDDKGGRKGNIVAAADIEISPQEQLHIQDKLDPEIHQLKQKKTGKLTSKLRKKPVKEDKTPRRIYFNDPPRNLSFKYLLNHYIIVSSTDRLVFTKSINIFITDHAQFFSLFWLVWVDLCNNI